jgi:hypothetical protein
MLEAPKLFCKFLEPSPGIKIYIYIYKAYRRFETYLKEYHLASNELHRTRVLQTLPFELDIWKTPQSPREPISNALSVFLLFMGEICVSFVKILSPLASSEQNRFSCGQHVQF